MKRRRFISNGFIFSAGTLLFPELRLTSNPVHWKVKKDQLYKIFSEPGSTYYPFVRWWWNGNKVEPKELVRELQLLKEAGIGGVEINPIEFPSREEGDDLDKPSLEWLSKEWIDMLQLSFDEASKLNMSCDLLVGSGWPFGSETLKPEERAMVILLDTTELNGPSNYEVSQFTIFKNTDPKVTVPYPGRTFKLISLMLVPDPVGALDEVIDLKDKINDEILNIKVPEGKYFLYALVRVDSFASVINGAPGAAGPILNHMDKKAVWNYLNRMSDTIQNQTGSLSKHLRAFFTDSMELEGCNWTNDFTNVFVNRRGYDIMPWLPFIMFKVGRLGGVIDFNYGATKNPAFEDKVNRVRFDFELTKAELLNERFTGTYLQWCKKLNVKSRAQSYGRGFFPLETSLGYDIPEGESWTTNWLKHRVGEEMPDDDYRRGRANTMINKYISSAAHLSGARIVSCEEMTNTYRVFNTSLELLKVGSDQSIISGITHSVWHGFNYSPPEASYPGWIQYGSYYNEKNNWWPYFKYLNKYKARISSILQNATMFTDIAILPANYDLWSKLGVQTDPFPEKLNVPYTSLIWESICKNGGAADYITEIIINESEIKDGYLCYGPKKYGTLIMAEVSGINPETLAKIYNFVSSGGRVFCIEKYPDKSLGMSNYRERNQKVHEWVNRLKGFNNNFILLKKPENNKFLEWYAAIMKEYNIPYYMDIEKPDRFLMQIRYQLDNNSEILFFANSHIRDSKKTNIKLSEDITGSRYGWIWDPETGKRFRIRPNDNGLFNLKLGPAESRIFVFDHNKFGEKWRDIPFTGINNITVKGSWKLEFIHCRGKNTESTELETLNDLKDISVYSDFSGTIIYRNKIVLNKSLPEYLNLGRVYDISQLIINGIDAGIKWYGYHIYDINGMLRQGKNEIEIRIITLMGNYMKSLTNNPNAQYWTNLSRKKQDPVSMGLLGPVTLYK